MLDSNNNNNALELRGRRKVHRRNVYKIFSCSTVVVVGSNLFAACPKSNLTCRDNWWSEKNDDGEECSVTWTRDKCLSKVLLVLISILFFLSAFSELGIPPTRIVPSWFQCCDFEGK